MTYQNWYNNLSIKDKSQEKRNLELIIESNNFSKKAKEIAKLKLLKIK